MSDSEGKKKKIKSKSSKERENAKNLKCSEVAGIRPRGVDNEYYCSQCLVYNERNPVHHTAEPHGHRQGYFKSVLVNVGNGNFSVVRSTTNVRKVSKGSLKAL